MFTMMTNLRSPALVVAALAPVLRRQPGRNPADNDDTTRHLSGRSVRVLAFRRRARRYTDRSAWPFCLEQAG